MIRRVSSLSLTGFTKNRSIIKIMQKTVLHSTLRGDEIIKRSALLRHLVQSRTVS